MSYLWQNYCSTNRYGLAIRNFSPYMEICNTGCVSQEYAVNVFFRFSAIFSELLDNDDVRNLIKNEANNGQSICNSDEINVLFHLFANFDRMSGITVLDIKMALVEKKIKIGQMGEYVREQFTKLGFREQYVVLLYWIKKLDTGNRQSFFSNVVTEIFGKKGKEIGSLAKAVPAKAGGISPHLYYLVKRNEFAVYINYSANSSLDGVKIMNEELLDFLEYLFLDITASVRVFWRYHFGIIGQDDTMRIDNIAIY